MDPTDPEQNPHTQAEPAPDPAADSAPVPDTLPPHPTLTEYFRQLGPVVGLLILLSLSAPAVLGTFVLGYGAISAFSANANFEDPAAPDYHPLAGDWAGDGAELKVRVDEDSDQPVTATLVIGTGKTTAENVVTFAFPDRISTGYQEFDPPAPNGLKAVSVAPFGDSIRIGLEFEAPPSVTVIANRRLPFIDALIASAGIPLAALLIALLFAFFTGSALLPTYALSFASGVFFGPVWGSLVAMFGVTFGALVGYAWGTLLARKRVMRVVEANPRVKLIRSAIIDRSIKDETVAVTLIRIPPNSPFALTNLIMSSLKVRLLPYFVGTFIGIAPRTLIAVFLGVGVGELAGAKSAGGQIRIALSIAVGLAVFIYIYRLFSRWVKERLAEHTGIPAGPPAEIRPASS